MDCIKPLAGCAIFVLQQGHVNEAADVTKQMRSANHSFQRISYLIQSDENAVRLVGTELSVSRFTRFASSGET